MAARNCSERSIVALVNEPREQLSVGQCRFVIQGKGHRRNRSINLLIGLVAMRLSVRCDGPLLYTP